MAKLKCVKHDKRVFVLPRSVVHRDRANPICGQNDLKVGNKLITADEIDKIACERAKVSP